MCCLFCHLCLCLFYFSSSSCHLCSVAHQVFISHSPFSIEGTVEEAEQRDKNLNYFVATWLPLRGSLITSVSLSLSLSLPLSCFLCSSLCLACHCFTLIFAHNDLICFSIGVAIEALDAWLPSDFLGRPSRRPENALTHTHTHRHPVCVWVGVFAFSSADIVCQLDIRHIINWPSGCLWGRSAFAKASLLLYSLFPSLSLLFFVAVFLALAAINAQCKQFVCQLKAKRGSTGKYPCRHTEILKYISFHIFIYLLFNFQHANKNSKWFYKCIFDLTEVFGSLHSVPVMQTYVKCVHVCLLTSSHVWVPKWQQLHAAESSIQGSKG